MHYITHPTLFTWEEDNVVGSWCMPECLWQWENNDQNVFIGWYSMVYYLSNIVYVFISQDHDRDASLVFLSEAWSQISVYEISITLTNLFSPFFTVVLYFPLKCIWLFSLIRVVRTAFSWDTTSLVFGKTPGLKHIWKYSPFYFTQMW